MQLSRCIPTSGTVSASSADTRRTRSFLQQERSSQPKTPRKLSRQPPTMRSKITLISVAYAFEPFSCLEPFLESATSNRCSSSGFWSVQQLRQLGVVRGDPAGLVGRER